MDITYNSNEKKKRSWVEGGAQRQSVGPLELFSTVKVVAPDKSVPLHDGLAEREELLRKMIEGNRPA